MGDWTKIITWCRGKQPEMQQATTAHQAAVRELSRRRDRLNTVLDMEGVIDQMKEARE